jgi:hypothetical protein
MVKVASVRTVETGEADSLDCTVSVQHDGCRLPFTIVAPAGGE